MTSPGWLVAIFTLFLINLIVGNVFGGEPQPLTATDVDTLGQMGTSSTTETQGVGGSMMAFFNVTGDALRMIWKSLICDYSFFYNYDTVTGARTPNDFYILRYFYLAITFAVFVTIGFLIFKYI